MEKKKYFTLSAGIMGTVVLSILTILHVLFGASAIDAANYGGMSATGLLTTIGVLYIVCGIIEFTAIGLNGASITAYKPEKRNKYKATLITTVVFNFVIILFSVILYVLATAVWLLIVGLILDLVLICANVFYIIDLAHKEVPQDEQEEQVVKTAATQTAVKKQAPTKEEQLLAELEKLVSLREKHILTQEEFDKIKAQIIAKHISE